MPERGGIKNRLLKKHLGFGLAWHRLQRVGFGLRKPSLRCKFVSPARTKIAQAEAYATKNRSRFVFCSIPHTISTSMPRPSEPQVPVTESQVLAQLARSRGPQSLREIAAALGLRHSARRALIKLTRKMKIPRRNHGVSEPAHRFAEGKAGRSIRGSAEKSRSTSRRVRAAASATAHGTTRGTASGEA